MLCFEQEVSFSSFTNSLHYTITDLKQYVLLLPKKTRLFNNIGKLLYQIHGMT